MQFGLNIVNALTQTLVGIGDLLPAQWSCLDRQSARTFPERVYSPGPAPSPKGCIPQGG
jgi:hypothetical protein